MLIEISKRFLSKVIRKPLCDEQTRVQDKFDALILIILLLVYCSKSPKMNFYRWTALTCNKEKKTKIKIQRKSNSPLSWWKSLLKIYRNLLRKNMTLLFGSGESPVISQLILIASVALNCIVTSNGFDHFNLSNFTNERETKKTTIKLISTGANWRFNLCDSQNQLHF